MPDVAERSLMRDPARLALACIPVVQYAEAYAAYKRANKAELKTWEGNSLMEAVVENDFELTREQLEGEQEGGE